MQRHAHRLGAVAVLLLAAASVAAGQQAGLAQGVKLYEAGNVAASEAVFAELAAADPDSAEAVYHLGLTRMELGRLDPAIASFERAIELDPSQSRYHQRLGEALGSKAGQVGVLKQMGLAGRVHDAFERAVELDPKNLEARFGLITFYLNAPGIAGGSAARALEQAEAIRAENAALGYRALAQVYVQQEEHDQAEAAFRAALESAPDDRDTYFGMGIFLTGRGRHTEAMEIYDAWLEHHPGDMGITYQVGRTASIAGEFLDRGRTALTAYATGHTPTPGEPSLAWANYRLGLILEQMGEPGAARAALQKALDLDPKHKQAKKALRNLR